MCSHLLATSLWHIKDRVEGYEKACSQLENSPILTSVKCRGCRRISPSIWQKSLRFRFGLKYSMADARNLRPASEAAGTKYRCEIQIKQSSDAKLTENGVKAVIEGIKL